MEPDFIPSKEERKLIEVIRIKDAEMVLVNGNVYMSWKANDTTSKRLAIVQLYRVGVGTQAVLSEAFGVHINSVAQYIGRFDREGTEGLIEQRRGPRRKWKVWPEIRKQILEIVVKEGEVDCEKIRKKLAQCGVRVSRRSIREVLKENGFLDEEREGGSGEEEEPRGLFDEGIDDEQFVFDFRSSRLPENDYRLDGFQSRGSGKAPRETSSGIRRQYSRAQREYLDHLEEGDYNAYAGGLLFTALIEKYSFLSILKRMIEIPHHEGYSLEQMCLTLMYLDIFGYRSIEDYKRAYAEEFGVLIGRSNSPRPKCIRRFLHRVRKLGIGERLIDEFATEYLGSGIAEWGVLYIDGHFMPYYGLFSIMKGWHGVRQKGMKGSYNFLGVDEHFTPWLFLVRSAMEDLLQKIPQIVEKAREIGRKVGIGEERLERLVVIFDREGYSAELYRLLDGREPGTRRVLFISWAKYMDKWVYQIPEQKFEKTVEIIYEVRKPQKIRYHETERMMSKYGKVRAIVIQSEMEIRRVAIYTNAQEEELGSEKVVQFMCRRWGEENLIKELMHKHRIDYTPGYVRELLSDQPLVANPQVQELKLKKAHLTAELSRLKLALADSVIRTVHENGQKQNPREDQSVLLTDILRTEGAIKAVGEQIKGLPEKVPYPQVHEGKRLVQLNYEKKRFLDCIKVFGYNMEKKFCSVLLKYFERRKEVYSVLSMIVRRGGYIKLEGKTLKVRLRRFQNREVDYAARHLCEEVNSLSPRTSDRYRIPLHFGVS